MRTTRRCFSESDDGFIRANYRAMLARDIARHVGFTVQSVRRRAARLGLSEPLKKWSEAEDEVIRASRGQRQLRDVAKELGRCTTTVSVRAKQLGLSPWRISSGLHSGRPVDGFQDGNPVFTHRRVVEDRIGRKLRSDEIVHHIDGNKFNNASSNLFVFKSRADHRKAHSTLESIMPALLERGIVEFDFIEGVYKLCAIDR